MNETPPELIQEFQNYSEEEAEKRRNAGGQFNEDLFEQALEIAIAQIYKQLEKDVL